MADDEDSTTSRPLGSALDAVEKSHVGKAGKSGDCYETARQSLMNASQRVHDLHSMAQLVAGISESPDVLNGYSDGFGWLGGRMTEATDALKAELEQLIEMVEKKRSARA